MVVCLVYFMELVVVIWLFDLLFYVLAVMNGVWWLIVV